MSGSSQEWGGGGGGGVLHHSQQDTRGQIELQVNVQCCSLWLLCAQDGQARPSDMVSIGRND